MPKTEESMTFTNQMDMNTEEICYYRKAYSPTVFDGLSLEEKHCLIDFTVEEFSNDVNVAYSDELCDEIGLLTEQDILLINSNMLVNPNKTYSLELYLFLYKTLMQRLGARKKNLVPVIEESYINKKYQKKDYKNFLLDIIVLHLLLDELLELNEVVLIDDEEREYLLGIIKEVSNRLAQVEMKTEPISIEAPKEQAIKFEDNNIGISKGR